MTQRVFVYLRLLCTAKIEKMIAYSASSIETLRHPFTDPIAITQDEDGKKPNAQAPFKPVVPKAVAEFMLSQISSGSRRDWMHDVYNAVVAVVGIVPLMLIAAGIKKTEFRSGRFKVVTADACWVCPL